LSIEYLQVSSRNTSYAYTTGRIRGLETRLLKDNDFARMKEATGLREALEILSKTSLYSEPMKKVEEDEHFEEALEEEMSSSYEDLRSFCPEPDLVDLFWLEYDFHNLKVLLRVHFQKERSEQRLRSGKELLISGTQDPQVLQEALTTENFADLSLDFQSLMRQTVAFAKDNPHPQEVDEFLDRKFFGWLSSKVKNYSDPFLDQLLRRKIDFFNVTSFLRVKFWHLSDEKELLERALVDGGTISKERLLKLAGQPEELLVKELKATDYGKAMEKTLKGEGKEESLFSLDKFFDEYILGYTRIGFYITFGREPLVNYILLKKREIENLRKVLRGKMAGFSQSEMERYVYV